MPCQRAPIVRQVDPSPVARRLRPLQHPAPERGQLACMQLSRCRQSQPSFSGGSLPDSAGGSGRSTKANTALERSTCLAATNKSQLA